MKTIPSLDADAIRFLALDKMSAEDFAELEKELCEDLAPLPLGPLTNKERAENFVELLEFFDVNADVIDSHVRFGGKTIEFVGNGKCVVDDEFNFPVRQGIIVCLGCMGRKDLIENVLTDAKGFDW